MGPHAGERLLRNLFTIGTRTHQPRRKPHGPRQVTVHQPSESKLIPGRDCSHQLFV